MAKKRKNKGKLREEQVSELRGMKTPELLNELFVQQNSIRVVTRHKKADEEIIDFTDEIKKHNMEHPYTVEIEELKAQIKELQKSIKDEISDKIELKKEAVKSYNDQIKEHKNLVDFILTEVYERKKLLNEKTL